MKSHNNIQSIFLSLYINLFCVFLIFFIISCTQEKPTNNNIGEAYKSGDIVDLASNGAWVWHTDPVTIWHKSRLFFAYVEGDQDKRIMMSSYDPNNNKKYPIELSTDKSFATDSHDHPAFSPMPDGNLYLSYNRHVLDKGFFFRRSKTNLPETIDDLTREMFFEFPVDDVTCYNNLYYLEDEKKLYYFGRWLDLNPTCTISNDLGYNWEKPIKIIDHKGKRPYVHYASNRKNRIDMIFTDGHPRKEKNSIYHIYYNKNNLYNSNGDIIETKITLPIYNQKNTSSIVYQYSEKELSEIENYNDWIPKGRAWVWDLEYTKKNEPVCVFSVRKSPSKGKEWTEGRIFYYYAWWTKEYGWQKRLISQGGNALYEKENDFAGGICLNPNDPSEVYFSSNSSNPMNLSSLKTTVVSNNEYSLYKGKFNRENKSFTSKLFLKKKGVMLIRPFVPAGESDVKSVLWMEGKKYINFKNYKTRITGWFEKQIVK